MVLGTFHTAPEQEQGPEQVLKLFQVVCFNDISVAFRCSDLASDTASVNKPFQYSTSYP